MARTTIKQLKDRRLAGTSAAERADFDETSRPRRSRSASASRSATPRSGRVDQRELAQRMGTSQAAIAHLEAGGVGATLTTLQRATSALNLDISVELRPAS